MERPVFSARETLKHILFSLLLFAAGNLLASAFFDLVFLFWKPPLEWMYQFIRYLGGLGLTWLLFWWYAKRLGLSLGAFGITPSLRWWAPPLGMLLPLSVAGVYLAIGELSVREVPFGEGLGMVLASLAMAASSGVTEEMAFRGYLMTLIRWRWGRRTALLLPSFLFAAAHIPGMGSLSLAGVALLLVSGTLVGVMFSLAAERGVANSALLHGLWNLVMVTQLLHITTPEGAWGRPLASILIPGGNLFLTGGDFGVEASLVSCAAYGAVCAILLLLERRRGR